MPDGVRSSGLLLRLESEIANAGSAAEAECKRAERAAYLARLGRVDEATRALRELQARNVAAPHLETSIRVNLAEGLIAYYDNFGASTTDRVQRAHALSVAAGLTALRALSAAWLAQWAYARLDLRVLAQHAREALQYAQPDDHAARSRACLVVAQGLHFGGRPDLAKSWYARSRMSAVSEGDDATVSAIMHNMAWLRMLSLRQATLTGQGAIDDGRFAMLSATSTDQLDGMTGNASWDELRPALRAQILSLQGDSAQAIKLYQAYAAATKSSDGPRAYALADQAWCHWSVGQRQEALHCAESAMQRLAVEGELDDRAATHSRLAQLYAAAGDSAQSRQHADAAAPAWRAHVQVQEQAVALLSPLDQSGMSV